MILLRKASMQDLMSFCRCSLGEELDENDDGVSTMRPAAFAKGNGSAQAVLTMAHRRTRRVGFESIMNILSEIANETVHEKGIPLRIAVTIPIHQRALCMRFENGRG